MITRVLLILLFGFTLGCYSPSLTKPVRPKVSPTQGLAQRMLVSPKFAFANYHISGVRDSATALQNMQQAAAGRAVRRSAYGRSPGGYCRLKLNMLRGMWSLANQGYSIRVSEVAGGEHSSRSRHYLGVAYDVTHINGVKVSWNNPYYRAYMRKARALGATEVLGPGDRGHSGHLHISWPRPTGQ